MVYIIRPRSQKSQNLTFCANIKPIIRYYIGIGEAGINNVSTYYRKLCIA